MKMRHNLPLRFKHLDQVRIQIPRLKAREAQPKQATNARAERLDQRAKRTRRGGILSAAQRCRLTKRPHEYPSKHNFQMPRINEAPRLFNRILDRLAPQLRPKL